MTFRPAALLAFAAEDLDGLRPPHRACHLGGQPPARQLSSLRVGAGTGRGLERARRRSLRRRPRARLDRAGRLRAPERMAGWLQSSADRPAVTTMTSEEPSHADRTQAPAPSKGTLSASR